MGVGRNDRQQMHTCTFAHLSTSRMQFYSVNATQLTRQCNGIETEWQRGWCTICLLLMWLIKKAFSEKLRFPLRHEC
jgi:hypothetical protein